MVLPALITAGAGLLGSLFGGKKKQETTSHVDYGRMVREAEAAGFNPLTALRNGGAAGFSVSSTPGAPLSDRIFSGLASATQTFFDNFDPFKDQKREAEYSLIDAQIKNLNASTANLNRVSIGGVPSGTGGRYRSGGAELAAKPGTGAGPNGQVLNIWTDWRDRDGTIYQLPNPDLPESEQFMVPSLGKAENAIFRPVEQNLQDKGWMRSRELTPSEKREREESWLPSWVPTFRYDPG